MTNKLRSLTVLARKLARTDTLAQFDAALDARHVYPSLRERLRQYGGRPLSEMRVLDFGCGYTYPMLVLLERDVKEVVGLEVAPTYRDGWWSTVREIGGLRKPGSSVEAVLDYWKAERYFRHLSSHAELPLRHPEYRIVQYDGARPPFPDASFDAVISTAVLQELPLPLERFAAEIARMLPPGGVIDLEWHNFYSWSGHYLGEAESRERPWGHLLHGRFHPCLNRVTPDDVRQAFAPWFTDLRVVGHDRMHRVRGEDPEFQPEGEEHLTGELEARLADYPRDLLLTRGYVLQGRRS